jgi:hypothetical protein
MTEGEPLIPRIVKRDPDPVLENREKLHEHLLWWEEMRSESTEEEA